MRTLRIVLLYYMTNVSSIGLICKQRINLRCEVRNKPRTDRFERASNLGFIGARESDQRGFLQKAPLDSPKPFNKLIIANQ